MLARVAGIVVFMACHRDFSIMHDASPSGTPDAGDGRTLVVSVRASVNHSIDILFSIDDSPGMLDKQTNLKSHFPAFVNVLNSIEGGLPSVHIGVISTDLGTMGTRDAVGGPGVGSGTGSCSGSGKNGNLQTNGTSLVSGSYINDSRNLDGTRAVNYTGSLTAAFSAIASLGAAGCGFEQQLESIRRALNNNSTNAGFLRPDALLAVVILTDEDDCSFSHSTLLGSDTSTLGPLQSFRCTRFGVTCSGGGNTPDEMNATGTKTGCQSNEQSSYLEPVETYSTFLKSLKSDTSNVLVGAITGPPSAFAVELRSPPGGGTAIPAVAYSCSYFGGTNAQEVADPAVRISQFVRSMARQSLSTICTRDQSKPLVELGKAIKLMIGDSCVIESLPAAPDCIVTEEVGDSSRTLPACSAGSMPCWLLVSDPAKCSAAPNLRLQIDRSEAPPANAVVSMRCRL